MTRWLKQVGDQVATDESLLEVSTDKVDTEIPSPAAGTLLEIKVNEDETVDVGAELAVIGSGDAGQATAAPESPARAGRARAAGRAAHGAAGRRAAAGGTARAAARARATEPQSQPAAAEPAAAQQASPAGGRDSSAYVTPLVRKMATQHGVDLAGIVGTGVGGRIRKQDVLDAAAQQGTDTTPTQPAAAAAAAAQPAAARTGGSRILAGRSGALAAAWQDRADDASAQGDRPADGRVAAGLARS